jgi:hypothetical protein
VEEIKESCKIRGLQGKSLKVGCSNLQVVKSRGVETVIGSREKEDCWIRNPIAYHMFWGSKVERSHFRLHE